MIVGRSYILLLSFLQRVRIARNADCCNSYGLSISLSVCPSVTFWCFVQTNEDMIVQSQRRLEQYSHSSLFGGKVYPDIHKGLPPAKALK